MQDGQQLWTIPTKARYFRCIALSPDERMAACITTTSGNRQPLGLRLFDLTARREIAQFDLGLEACDRAVFSPDGRRVLVGFYDGTALVYDVSEARHILRGE